MVDLHCHILPGLDDGPATMEAALELARAAEAAGIDTVVATPHIRDDHLFPLDLLDQRLGAVGQTLGEAGIDLEVIGGGEVSVAKLVDLDDAALTRLCLGHGRYLLVESPYTRAPSLLETALFDLQVRGFRPVLAHPERSPSFLEDRARIERLVERGVLCSGDRDVDRRRFRTQSAGVQPRPIRQRARPQHRSDAHDARRRAPGFESAFAALRKIFGGETDGMRWFTDALARAIIEGWELPAGAPTLARPSGWKRVRERIGLA